MKDHSDTQNLCLILFATVLVAAAQTVVADEASKPDIERLVHQLGDDSFIKREEATGDLTKIGEPALAALREAAKASEDAEVRVRAKLLVGKIERSLYGTFRQFGPHKGEPVPWSTRVLTTKDGKQLVSAGHDGLRVWDVVTGQLDQHKPCRLGGAFSWTATVVQRRALQCVCDRPR